MRIFLVLLFLAPSFVFAQRPAPKSTFARPAKAGIKDADGFKAIFFIANDTRFERNESMGYSPRPYQSLGFGLRYKENYLGFIEGGSFRETTSVGNVEIRRKFETVNFSGALMTELRYFAPYVGAGLAMTRDTAEMSIDDSSSTSRSGWEPLNHFFAGARLFPGPHHFWASLEAKFTVGGRVDPNPMAGILFRIGAEY